MAFVAEKFHFLLFFPLDFTSLFLYRPLLSLLTKSRTQTVYSE